MRHFNQIRQQQLEGSMLACLSDAEFSVFSQWGEDGVISFLTDTLSDIPKTFVEFGVEDFREANCRYLTMHKNWSGLVIDGSETHRQSFRKNSMAWKYDINFCVSFITRDNIQGLIDTNGFGHGLGILSVDIDRVDYWVLEKIKTQADIVIVEYNDFLGERPITVPYDAAFVWEQKHWSNMYWGAALPAFRKLLEGRGYTFLGTNSVGTNAFFVLDKHSAKVTERMEAIIAHPCKMREVSQQDGTPAYKTYAESSALIADMDVIDLDSGDQIKVRDLRASGASSA